jgi:ABC-type sugar transport system permease subunit
MTVTVPDPSRPLASTSKVPVGPSRSALERRWAWILLAPALSIIALLAVVPIGRAVWTSLHQTSPLLPSKFTGLKNFTDVIGGDQFFPAWLTTLCFAAFTVVLTTILALASASLLNTSFPGSRFVKPMALLPWAVPGVIAGVMWRWMFNDSWGPVNAVLNWAGIISDYIPWLSTSTLAFLCVGVAQTWSFLPLAITLLLAAMQGIPQDQYEAAKLDGAGVVKCYRYVTLPNIRSMLIIVVLYLGLMGLTAYDVVYTMTSGGPGTATTLISYFTWAISFKELNFGQGSALATLIAVVSLVFIIGLLRALPQGALDEED